MIPIWGAWVDGRWYVEGGPTRWQRNLRANPQIAIHVEFGDEVVIVEGPARELVAPPEPLADADPGRLRQVPPPATRRAPATGPRAGLWELHPVKAFAWSTFPDDMTRFTFAQDA